MAQIPERTPNMEGPLEADPDVSAAINSRLLRNGANRKSSSTMAQILALVTRCKAFHPSLSSQKVN